MKKKSKYFDKIIITILSWGLPGVIILILMAASPYAGAVALTSTLAFIGGPLGMVGGVIVTIPAMVLLSRKGASFIIPRIRENIKENYTQSEVEAYILKKTGKLRKKTKSVINNIFN